MSRRAQAIAGVALVLFVFFIALISGITLGPSLISISSPAAETGRAVATITPTASIALEPGQTVPAVTPTASITLERARALVVRVREEVIPREGLATDYGVSFSQEGYKTLIRWNGEVKVDEQFAGDFEALDLRLPCCEWTKPSRDEKLNCACGHHQALEGLAKKLLAAGQPRAAVQAEVSRWARYMYPKEALAAEMARRARLDPEIKAALEELQARGEC